jgi:hypothetical protein
VPVTLELIWRDGLVLWSIGDDGGRCAYAEEFAVGQHAFFQAGCEEVDVILHQLVDCAFRCAGCHGFIAGVGFRFVFGGVEAAHEGTPVGLDDFRCAEVEKLLDEDEHSRAGQ